MSDEHEIALLYETEGVNTFREGKTGQDGQPLPLMTVDNCIAQTLLDHYEQEYRKLANAAAYLLSLTNNFDRDLVLKIIESLQSQSLKEELTNRLKG